MHTNLNLRSLLLELWTHISSRRRAQLAVLFVLMLLGTIAELFSLGMALPFLGALTSPERVFAHPLAKPWIEVLALERPDQILFPLTALFGAAALFSGAMRLALLWAQTHLGNAIGHDLGTQAYRRTLYQPYEVQIARNSSAILSVLMTKINSVVYFIIIPLLTILTSVFIVLMIAGFMFFVAPLVTAVSVAVFALLYVCVGGGTKKKLAQDSVTVTEGQKRATQIIQESLGGIRDVLIDGIQEWYAHFYMETDGKIRRSLSRIAFIGGAPRPIIESFGLVFIGAFACYAASREGGFQAIIPLIGALALGAQRVLPLVQQAYGGWASMLGGKGSLKDVLDLLSQPMPNPALLADSTPIPFEKMLELRSVGYRYPETSVLVLDGISLQIPRGSRIGLIGETGSGKSTLLDIVMGLLLPAQGSLVVDGVPVSKTNQRAWQAHVAHVPQNIFLADASIAENIAFGLPPEQIDRQRVREAAQRAQIADTIEQWEHQYDTVVGERGVRLSGGQRQRIGIARALYRQASLIILDEATSALDHQTETQVMDSIYALGPSVTLLMVAHRLTTLRNCDFLVKLEKGGVERVGTYAEIVGK